MPNPSFELLDSCPDGQDQIERCVGWEKYCSQNATPDYYNVCATVQSGFNVPDGVGNFQYAHSGNAYAGLITFWPPACLPYSCKEHIGIQLAQALTIGQKYFISFYVVLGGEKFTTLMPSNKIGVKLSTVPFSTINPIPINNMAHLYTDSIITDSINWTLIRGSIIADSAYQYLIAGNFFDDANTDTIKWYPNSVGSYYLVDDFCLSTDSLLCNLPVGINETKNQDELILFPNPFRDKMNITTKRSERLEVSLYDVTSRKIFNQSFTNSTSINTEQLAKGIYLYEVRNKNGVIKKGKVVKD